MDSVFLSGADLIVNRVVGPDIVTYLICHISSPLCTGSLPCLFLFFLHIPIRPKYLFLFLFLFLSSSPCFLPAPNPPLVRSHMICVLGTFHASLKKVAAGSFKEKQQYLYLRCCCNRALFFAICLYEPTEVVLLTMADKINVVRDPRVQRCTAKVNGRNYGMAVLVWIDCCLSICGYSDLFYYCWRDIYIILF